MARRRGPITTPRSCPACGGGEGKASCRLCLGSGVVRREAAARWQRERMDRMRITTQFHRIEAQAASDIGELERRATEAAKKKAVEGRALLAECERMAEMPSGTPGRNEALVKLQGWQMEAIAMLTGKR